MTNRRNSVFAVLLWGAAALGCGDEGETAHAIPRDVAPGGDALADAGGAIAIGDELTVEPLGPALWRVIHHRPWAANALLAEMPDGTLVLCDTPYDDQATTQLLAWIRQHFGPRRMVAVNSHYHADAMGGNAALHRAGVTTIGSDLSGRLLESQGPRLREQLVHQLRDRPDLQARFRGSRWEPPQQQFPAAEGLALDFGGETIVLYHPGPAHSPDNIVVWFPARATLFGGCMVRAAPRLPDVADADLEHWPRAVDDLRRRFEARIVVPGHGRPGGPELLDVTLQAIREHRDRHPDPE